MTDDDPRHGTVNGYKNHKCRCTRCSLAYSRYNKRRDYLAATGRSLRVSSRGTQRRVRALQRLGYGLPFMASELGIATGNLSYKLHQPYVARRTHESVARMFERLAMLPPPEGWVAQRTRGIAERRGWPAPLAWDDIDNDPAPAATPERAEEIDRVVVDRLLAGDRIPSTRAEKDEAMRRWKAAGRSERSLCLIHGWKDSRYGKDVA